MLLRGHSCPPAAARGLPPPPRPGVEPPSRRARTRSKPHRRRNSPSPERNSKRDTPVGQRDHHRLLLYLQSGGVLVVTSGHQIYSILLLTFHNQGSVQKSALNAPSRFLRQLLLTLSLFLCSSGSNAQGKSRALEGGRVSLTSPSKDGDEGVAGRNYIE